MSDETTPLNETQPCLDHDREAREDGKTGLSRNIDRGFLAIAFLGVYLGAADDSFVLATHSEIASRFQQAALGPWLISAYTLGYMTTLPLYGRLSYLYGARCILLIAYLSFTIGCGMTGLAPSIWVAIVGRLVAGLGAAGITDLVSIIVNDWAPPKQAAVIRSYFGIFVPLGISTGAPFGGILTDVVGWRLPFLIQVPLGLVCFFITYWRLPTPAELDIKQKPGGSTDYTKPDVNAPGIILLALVLGSLMVLCHSVGGNGQAKDIRLIISIGCAILFGFVFWWHEKYRTKFPLMPMKAMLANRIWVIYLAHFLVYFSLFGIISNMSEYFTRTMNASNKSSGTFFVVLTIGSVLGSVVSGYSIRKTGKYKMMSLVGLLTMTIAVILFLVRWPQGPYPWEVCYLAIQGFGFMAFNAAFFVAISVSVPRDSGASAVTSYYLAQQMGILVGVNSTAAVTRSMFKNHLKRNLDLKPMANKIIQNVLRDNRFAFEYLSPNLQEIVAYTFMRASFVPPSMCLVSLLFAVPTICFLPRRTLDQ